MAWNFVKMLLQRSIVCCLLLSCLLPSSALAIDHKSSLQQIEAIAPHLSSHVAEAALRAAVCASKKLRQPPADKLGVIDYSLPSTAKRFWMFDLVNFRLLAEELVAHGKNTGLVKSERFSNVPGSLQSSLGLFRVGSSYIGKHGKSLELIGLEAGINDMAQSRAIVIHGADYVSKSFLQLHNRLGRSWGCPALSPEATAKVIDFFSRGTGYLFAYSPDPQWLSNSELQGDC